MTPKVLILLACYNGAVYIPEMVESLIAQDYDNIRIVASDDHSTDETWSVLEKLAHQYPEKMTCYRPQQRCGSAQKHFMHLLRNFHDAPYVMFCDQDDVWHPDKVSKTLELMQKIEEAEKPCLVHTDLRVVDQNLQEISPSFCAHSGLDGKRLALNQLLVQNVVTGCTMMLNRALAELACREADEASMMMHDWWIAMLASCCGKVAFLEEATIDYRQHGNNAVGAKDVRSAGFLWKRLTSHQMRRSICDAIRQAEVFGEVYGDLLTQEQKELIRAFSDSGKAGFFRRNRIYIRYGLLKKGAVRVAAQFLGL